jgi:hypothetical protein
MDLRGQVVVIFAFVTRGRLHARVAAMAKGVRRQFADLPS